MKDTAAARIARELHDNVNQLLTFALIQLQRRDPVSAAVNVRAAISEIRRISRGVPPELEGGGLAGALRILADDFTRATGARLRLRNDVTRLLDADLEIGVFRIVQEGLTNVAKHSRAKSASVTVSTRRGGLRIVIADDGRGLPTSAGAAGLRSVRERVLLLGGALFVGSAPRKGTRLVADLPASGRP